MVWTFDFSVSIFLSSPVANLKRSQRVYSWNWMVGMRSFPFGPGLCFGGYVSFGKGTSSEQNQVMTSTNLNWETNSLSTWKLAGPRRKPGKVSLCHPFLGSMLNFRDVLWRIPISLKTDATSPKDSDEVLNLFKLFRGWGFPYIGLTYCLHRWRFLDFRYLNCLVKSENIWDLKSCHAIHLYDSIAQW